MKIRGKFGSKTTFRMKAKSLFLIVLLSAVGFNACILPDLGNTSLIDRLHKAKYVSVDFNADIQSNNDIVSFSLFTVDNYPLDDVEINNFDWNGNSFNASYDYTFKTFDGERIRTYGSIIGTLSDDGETLESLIANQTSLHLDTDDVFKYFLTVIDVPYNPDYDGGSFYTRFSVEGEQVKNNIYSYDQSWEFINSEGETHTVYSTNVYYNNPDDVPYLHITFSEI